MRLSPPLLLALPLSFSLPIAYADDLEYDPESEVLSQSNSTTQSETQTNTQTTRETTHKTKVPEQSEVSGWYMGAFVSAQEQDWDSTTREFEAAGGLLGYRINRFWALEARLATGTSGYSRHYPHIKGSRDGDYSEEIDHQEALLLKAFIPITDNLSLYGLIGAARTTLEVSGIDQIYSKGGKPLGNYRFTESYRTEDMTYGGGLNYAIKDRFEIFAEYQVLPQYEPSTDVSTPNVVTVDWESLNAGVIYRF